MKLVRYAMLKSSHVAEVKEIHLEKLLNSITDKPEGDLDHVDGNTVGSFFDHILHLLTYS